MKVSVDRLRWALAAAVVLLLGGLVAWIGYGRYAAKQKWAEILRRNGITITHDNNNITWSQAVKGHTVYTIRAKKAVQIGDGKYTLHGVTMLLYGKTSDRVDRVQGDEFQYDQKAGVAKADGEVHIDIQAPGALRRDKPGGTSQATSAGTEADLDRDTHVIHVLTSGLVYVQKLGVAATDQHVEFHYGGVTCVSRGAEFDTNGNALHLLADVVMTGDLHGASAVVHASKADLDREKNTIAVLQPVVESRGESARAANSLLLLQPDGSLQHASAWGSVLLESPSRHVTAQRLEASFAAQNQPENAVLSGGVTLDGSPAKPMHGTATEADLAFTPKGAISGVTAKGAVRLVSSVPRPAAPNATGAPGSTGAPPLARELRGDQVIVHLRPGTNGKQMVLQQVHAVGAAFARGESFATAKSGAKPIPGGGATNGITATQLAADDLLADFAPPDARSAAGKKQPSLQHLVGRGHTRLQQIGLNQAEEDTSGDTLEAVFAPGAGPHAAPGHGVASMAGTGSLRLSTAVQTGHVQIRDQAETQGSKRGALSTAHGDRAAFDGASDRLLLTGGAAYQQEGTSLTANSISVEQGSGNAEAEGSVEASVAQADHDATHVLADHAKLMRAAQTAEFLGTDAHPARLWQGGSQVMAANLFLDDAHQSLAAKPASSGGLVEAIFAASPTSRTAGAGGDGSAGARATTAEQRGRQGGSGLGSGSSSGGAVHVSSPALNYSGLRHEAVCTGGVRVRQGVMQIHSQDAVVFLAGAPADGTAAGTKPGSGQPARPVSGTNAGPGQLGQLNGTVERMVFTGDVRLDEPGRAGDGEQLVYVARDSSYLLTGTPGKLPRVADAVQGMVTGPSLLFRSGEKSVIVNGAAASNAHDPGGRVHTELNVRPQER